MTHAFRQKKLWIHVNQPAYELKIDLGIPGTGCWHQHRMDTQMPVEISALAHDRFSSASELNCESDADAGLCS